MVALGSWTASLLLALSVVSTVSSNDLRSTIDSESTRFQFANNDARSINTQLTFHSVETFSDESFIEELALDMLNADPIIQHVEDSDSDIDFIDMDYELPQDIAQGDYQGSPADSGIFEESPTTAAGIGLHIELPKLPSKFVDDKNFYFKDEPKNIKYNDYNLENYIAVRKEYLAMNSIEYDATYVGGDAFGPTRMFETSMKYDGVQLIYMCRYMIKGNDVKLVYSNHIKFNPNSSDILEDENIIIASSKEYPSMIEVNAMGLGHLPARPHGSTRWHVQGQREVLVEISDVFTPSLEVSYKAGDSTLVYYYPSAGERFHHESTIFLNALRQTPTNIKPLTSENVVNSFIINQDKRYYQPAMTSGNILSDILEDNSNSPSYMIAPSLYGSSLTPTFHKFYVNSLDYSLDSELRIQGNIRARFDVNTPPSIRISKSPTDINILPHDYTVSLATKIYHMFRSQFGNPSTIHTATTGDSSPKFEFILSDNANVPAISYSVNPEIPTYIYLFKTAGLAQEHGFQFFDKSLVSYEFISALMMSYRCKTWTCIRMSEEITRGMALGLSAVWEVDHMDTWDGRVNVGVHGFGYVDSISFSVLSDPTNADIDSETLVPRRLVADLIYHMYWNQRVDKHVSFTTSAKEHNKLRDQVLKLAFATMMVVPERVTVGQLYNGFITAVESMKLSGESINTEIVDYAFARVLPQLEGSVYTVPEYKSSIDQKKTTTKKKSKTRKGISRALNRLVKSSSRPFRSRKAGYSSENSSSKINLTSATDSMQDLHVYYLLKSKDIFKDTNAVNYNQLYHYTVMIAQPQSSYSLHEFGSKPPKSMKFKVNYLNYI